MTASVRRVVRVDGQTQIILVEPSEPECWIEPDFGGEGEGALFFAHDCVGGQGLSERHRSEGVLRSDKYPRMTPDYPTWTIVSEDPLTVSPSILCGAPGCNTHGFYTAGKWVPA